MAKKSTFNLSGTIRDFQQSHPGVSAKDAFEAIKKANPSQKINVSTFKAVFYKFAGGGKRKVVRRRKPVHVVPGHGSADHIMRAGLQFIRLAGGVETARERLVGLEELIEAAKTID
jgi:hypothetical protein